MAASDTLNVRKGPSTGYAIIDRLAPDAAGIEVVDTDKSGEWGLISVGENAGWVSLAYMARRVGQPAEGLPRRLSCSGTEPFWSFTLSPDRRARFERAGQSTSRFSSTEVMTSENRPDRHALFADGGDTVITSMIGRGLCSDGMSDRAYGLGIDLLVTDKKAVRVYSGCCSVLP